MESQPQRGKCATIDMHHFVQSLWDTRQRFPARILVTYKSDVKNTFLDLSRHPIGAHQVLRLISSSSSYAPSTMLLHSQTLPNTS